MVAMLAATKHDEDDGHEVLVADMEGETEPALTRVARLLGGGDPRFATVVTPTRTISPTANAATEVRTHRRL